MVRSQGRLHESSTPPPERSGRSLRVRGRTWATLGLLCVVYLVLAIGSLLGKSVTVDEFAHLPAGHNVLRTGDFEYCELNPPLMNSLSALPVLLMRPQPTSEPRPGQFAEIDPGHSFWLNGYAFMFDYQRDYRRIFTAARCVTVALVGLLGWLLFFWARTLAPDRGDHAGLLAATLVWFSPNMLAHGRLATTDAGAACFVALAVCAFHFLLMRPNGWRALVCGAALGIAQLVKFTAVYLYPIFIVVALFWKLCEPTSRRWAPAKWLALSLAVSVATINIGYFFDGSGASVGRFELASSALKTVQSRLPASTPVLLPREYVAAFDRQLRDVEAGDPSYLLGESFMGGRWYYFLVLIVFKTPIPLLVLGVLAVVVGTLRRGIRLSDSVLLLAPPAVFLVMFSLFANKQLGIRMILPAAPLLYLWIATTLMRAERTRWMRWSVASLLVWFGAETLRIHPDYLTYFNQFAGGPAGGRRIALDSNLDWGQDLPKLKRYMDKNGIETIQLLYFGRVDPEIYGIQYQADPRRIRAGPLAISATLFGREYVLYDHGTPREVGPLDRGRFGHPVATLGNSIEVFRLDAP